MSVLQVPLSISKGYEMEKKRELDGDVSLRLENYLGVVHFSVEPDFSAWVLSGMWYFGHLVGIRGRYERVMPRTRRNHQRMREESR
jgi:hypothetical protein